MSLEEVEFPQYAGTRHLQADDLAHWVTEANTVVEKSGRFNYQRSKNTSSFWFKYS